MLLQFEEYNGRKDVHTDNIEDAFSYLKKLHPFKFPYIILQNKNGDYIQFAGGVNKMVIEVRYYDKESFKHYVLGHLQQSKVLTSIDCKIGPINILQSEVLNINDAYTILSIFVNQEELAKSYLKRNITKRFKQI